MSVYGLGSTRRGAVRPSPVFFGILAATALGGWLAARDNTPGARLADFGVFLFVVAGWIVSVCVHEFAHAYAAYRAGDRSVEAAGYLTLNPLRYAHPVLSLLIPLVFIVQGGIGLPGGAVYLHRHAFRSRPMQSLAAAAGPAVNALLAVLLLGLANAHAALGESHIRLWSAVAFLGLLQITAAVLNLLPVPGLDGFAIIEPYLAPQTVRSADVIKPWGMLAVLLILQVDKINAWFFDVVYKLYDLSGTPEVFASFGYSFFKFWQHSPL